MAGSEAEKAHPVKLSPGRVLGLFLFGALVLTFFDGFHTHSGTTVYTTELFLKAAWWAPLNFGLGVALGGPIFAIIYSVLGGTKAPPSFARLAPGFVVFACCYYFSGFYKGSNEHKLAVLSAAATGLYLVYDRTLPGLICLLVTSATGPVVEITLVHLGLFKHLQPDWRGIPVWLPGLYAVSAPVIGHGCRRVLCRPV